MKKEDVKLNPKKNFYFKSNAQNKVEKLFPDPFYKMKIELILGSLV